MGTDSFILSSEKDFYETIKENPERFATSNYKLENKFNIVQANNREPGKLKDEHAGRVITSFAGLKAKAYSCLVDKEGNENECIKKTRKNAIVEYLDYQSPLLS